MAYGPLRTHFISRKRIVIDEDKCVGCTLCMRSCSVSDVIVCSSEKKKVYVKNARVCGGCAACIRTCPTNAIHMHEERIVGGYESQPKINYAPGQTRRVLSLSSASPS